MGTLALSQVKALAEEGVACSGDGGYNDIKSGAQVKVSDDAGKVIGLGSLGKGVTQKSDGWGYGGTDICLFDFEVTGVPLGGTIFGVEVTHRGVIQFKADEADSVKLSLG